MKVYNETTDSVARLEFLEILWTEDMVIREKGEMKTEVPMVTTGKETDGHRREKLGQRTDRTDHPSPSSFSLSQTQASPS